MLVGLLNDIYANFTINTNKQILKLILLNLTFNNYEEFIKESLKE